MMFDTLQGLKIPEGVVTQIAKGGVILWAVQNDVPDIPNKPIILEVEKITSDTYAGETTYTGEEFVLLNISPKESNSVVNVTYEGLTKTLTFSGTNSQKVFFGTFNGVSDSEVTPSSGTLVIENARAVAIGTFAKSSKSPTNYCNCVTGFVDFGNIKSIYADAFRYCTKLSSVILPNGITSIGNSSFWGCTGISEFFIPQSVSSFGYGVFYDTNFENPVTVDANNSNFYIEGNCLMQIEGKILSEGFIDSTIPADTEKIRMYAFYGRAGLTSVTIPASVTNIEMQAFGRCTGLTSVSVLATTPPTAGMNIFGSLTMPIYVPKGCGDTYKTAEGWSTYADYITEAS